MSELAQELLEQARTVGAEQSALVRGVRKMHPETFERIRRTMQEGSRLVDFDEHAAQVVLQVVRARGFAA